MKKSILALSLTLSSIILTSTDIFAQLPNQKIIEGRPRMESLGNGRYDLYCPGSGGCAITWERNGKTLMKIDGISGVWEVLSATITPQPEDLQTETFNIVPYNGPIE